MGKLEGKTAIVTGAASGLGEATARRFAQEGARDLLTDIPDEGAAVARDIGGDAPFLPQDGANEARLAEVVGHADRSEKRPVGKECVSACRIRWAPGIKKKK